MSGIENPPSVALRRHLPPEGGDNGGATPQAESSSPPPLGEGGAERREGVKPELLCPAGDMARLKMAVAYGADAVYLGGSEFGMRAFAGNFTESQLKAAVEYAHAHGVKVHCTVNTMPRNDEAERLPAYLEALDAFGVDALIIADFGVFRMAQRYAPRCALHVSTQAGVTNYAAARAWHDEGASRVILARELSLDEIRAIRERVPASLELEAFVHGAMCVSYSGRCLLSNYMTGRDSSRGACAQPCRYRYALMEEKRPGEYFPIEQDAKGAYILNSRDMRMIEHLPDLIGVGLDSLKIEGRAKSTYYAAVITGAYRHALDDACAGRPADPVWIEETNRISHRPYCTGFYYGQPGEYYADSRYVRDWQVIALVTDCDADGNATLSLRNKFRVGDAVELIGPGLRPQPLTVPDTMTDVDGTRIQEPRTPQMVFHMKFSRKVPPLSLLRRYVGATPENSPPSVTA